MAERRWQCVRGRPIPGASAGDSARASLRFDFRARPQPRSVSEAAPRAPASSWFGVASAARSGRGLWVGQHVADGVARFSRGGGGWGLKGRRREEEGTGAWVPDEAPWPPPPSSWPSEPTASESTGRGRQGAGGSLTSMAARASGSLGYVGADNSTGVAKEAIARNRVRGSESLRGRADGNSLILKSEQILVDFRLAVLLCRVYAILA